MFNLRYLRQECNTKSDFIEDKPMRDKKRKTIKAPSMLIRLRCAKSLFYDFAQRLLNKWGHFIGKKGGMDGVNLPPIFTGTVRGRLLIFVSDS